MSPCPRRCVWHNAAAVGPFHPYDLYPKEIESAAIAPPTHISGVHPDLRYFKVNYEGTLNVIRACRAKGVRKIVMSSSPSTRFDGSDVDGVLLFYYRVLCDAAVPRSYRVLCCAMVCYRDVPLHITVCCCVLLW